jgi:hypothetical protein
MSECEDEDVFIIRVEGDPVSTKTHPHLLVWVKTPNSDGCCNVCFAQIEVDEPFLHCLTCHKIVTDVFNDVEGETGLDKHGEQVLGFDLCQECSDKFANGKQGRAIVRGLRKRLC